MERERVDGPRDIGRLGAVLGELRAKLGGDVKAAYALTQQGRSGGGAIAGDDPTDSSGDAEGE